MQAPHTLSSKVQENSGRPPRKGEQYFRNRRNYAFFSFSLIPETISELRNDAHNLVAGQVCPLLPILWRFVLVLSRVVFPAQDQMANIRADCAQCR